MPELADVYRLKQCTKNAFGHVLTPSPLPQIDGSKGASQTSAPRSKFFHFHAVFRKINGQTIKFLHPHLELVSPPRGNPGSATGADYVNYVKSGFRG